MRGSMGIRHKAVAGERVNRGLKSPKAKEGG